MYHTSESISLFGKISEKKERCILTLETEGVAILTINDRATGLGKLRKLEGKDAEQLALATIDCLNDWKPFLKTITSDNGKEFANHQMVAQELNIDFFFAKPYASWQRGSNENYNRLVRQYIPKKVHFDCIPEDYVNFVETQINNRPRKRFNYESPVFMFNQKVAFST